MAIEWFDWLVADINDAVLKQEVVEAVQATEFLHKQVENTSLVGLQTVLSWLIEEEAETGMLASASNQRLFRILDPAVIPELKVRPRRLIIVSVATFLSGFLLILFVLIRHASARRLSD